MEELNGCFGDGGRRPAPTSEPRCSPACSLMLLRDVEPLQDVGQSHLQQLDLIFLHLHPLLQVGEAVDHVQAAGGGAAVVCGREKAFRSEGSFPTQPDPAVDSTPPKRKQRSGGCKAPLPWKPLDAEETPEFLC